MAGELEITRIELLPPEPRGKVDLDTGEPPRWFGLEITDKNSSAQDVFVVASVRSLSYDSASRTLDLMLAEPVPHPNPEVREHRSFVLPAFTAVASESTETVRVAVPEVINKITAITAGDGIEVEQVDLSDLHVVRCTQAYSQTPFDPQLDLSPDDLRRRLSSWGSTTVTTAEVGEQSTRRKRPGQRLGRSKRRAPKREGD